MHAPSSRRSTAPWLLLTLMLLLLAAGGARAERLLFVTASPVAPGKFVRLAEIGQRHGFEVDARYVENLPARQDGSLFAGADLVLFDAPRPHIQALVRARLEHALPALAAGSTPYLWLGEPAHDSGGLPAPLPPRWRAYLDNGGAANFDNFFLSVAAQLRRLPQDDSAAPVVFPDAGIYHPRAPQTVFADAAGYLHWKGVDPAAAAPRPPVIAIALHQSYIAAMQTGFIDDLIGRIEAGGGIALPYYASVMAPQAPLFSVAGKPLADAVINTQIVLDPEGRRRELAALGIPVIQALSYRHGDAAAWRADQQGLPLADIPFFLAQGEYAGMVDAMVAAGTETAAQQVAAIPEQAAAVVAKAFNLVRLQRTPNADKKLAVLFWNYPPGEKNLSASYLNLPASLVSTLRALHGAGYDAPPADEAELLAQLQRLLAPFYRDGTEARLRALLRDGLADRLSVGAYRRWLATLPPAVRADLRQRWGEPEQSAMVIRDGGVPVFVIPRVALGKLVFTPQAPRGEKWDPREKAIYHSTTAGPSHFYLAQYLWARQAFGADALIHFGTHGTQEWLPGKERGLSVHDYPLLAVGDVPVVYPYIVDNIGEALQARRRGRAVIVSHQTPPFAPAGLHEMTTRIHDLLHQWLAQEPGAVRERLAADLTAAVKKERIERDLGWDDARIGREFSAFVELLHNHLHELAQSAQPLGLHSFGQAPRPEHRLGTVLLMLGQRYWELAAQASGVAAAELDENFVADYRNAGDAAPARLLRAYLDGVAPAGATPELLELLAQGKTWYGQLGAAGETDGLLTALAGRLVPTSYGGDPIKNPDALPTGRNLYGFDPSRVPTRQAWAVGRDAADALLAAHRQKTGALPKKLAFSLWSVETMRHQGMLEAQALWLLGAEPVWDAGGRVTGVRLIPRAQLGRPRVDTVLSATGLYRDHFPNVIRILAQAAELAARADGADEADNPVAVNSRAIAARLAAQGVAADAARRAAETRLFSSESGRYGTGLDDAALATDTWNGKADGDRKLAQLYLARMQYGYGTDEAAWGRAGVAGGGDGAGGAGINLYAEQLKGTDGAVLSRSSNLYGMLTTDDPFQYLGGLSLAVRALDGKPPALYISNLRGAGTGTGTGAGSGGGKVEDAATFLAKELATRNFHPGYIQGLMAEGYAGTLQVLDSVNNFWGWTAVAREVVRDDQWQEFVDVYVRDKHQLGLRDWFESNNPQALAQTIERMLEAARQGYWQADAATVGELKSRYRELAQRHDAHSGNAAFEQFVAPGFGLQAAQPAAASASALASAPAAAPEPAAEQQLEPPPPLQGLKLEKVAAPPAATPAPLLVLLALALLGLATLGGIARALLRHERESRTPAIPVQVFSKPPANRPA